MDSKGIEVQSIKKKRVRRKLRLSIYKAKGGSQFTHSRNEVKKKGNRPIKRKLPSDNVQVESKIQVMDVGNMGIREMYEVCKGINEINVTESDETCGEGAKVFTMEFNVNKCKEDLALLKSGGESADKSKDSTEGQYTNGSSGDVEGNSKRQNSPIEEDVEDVLDDRTMQLWLRKFKNDDVLKALIQKLHEAKLLKDFYTLIEVISTGDLEAENLPLILCLERAKYCKCTTTTLMRFHEKSKAFWRVGYRTWHGKGLLLMSGSKNRGQVRDNLTRLGYYKPEMSSINFVVPDVRTLFNEGYGFPKEIAPTKCIQEAFDLLDKSKDHILLYDFKKVVRGLKGHKKGDEDMWSFEGPPTLEETYNRLQEELHILYELKEVCEENNLQLLAYHTSRLLNCLSVRIKEMRTLECFYKRQLAKYQKDPKISEMKKSFAIAQIYLTKACTKQSLNVNRDLCSILSKLNNMKEEFQETGNVDLNVQSNLDILLSPEVLQQYCNLKECPQFVKQRTDMWFNLRRESRVTGSTCFKALGFGLLREHQEHFDTFVLKKDPKPFSTEIQRKLDHGKINEIHGIATICAILMPSLLPSCMQFVEDGCCFVDGDVIPKLLEVSSDGIIECHKGNHYRPCDSNAIGGHYRRVVEIKCLSDESMLSMRYSVPIYHACQLLCEMYAKSVKEAWYILCAENSVLLTTVQFSDEVWDELWNIIKETYDTNNPIRPQRRNKQREEFKKVLKEYVVKNCEFICEVPKVNSLPIDSMTLCCRLSPYRSVLTCRNKAIEFKNYVEDVHYCLTTGEKLINDAFNIQRKPAGQVLAFVLTDADREYNKKHPSHSTIAYALVCGSVNMDTFRKMLYSVLDVCKEQKVRILSECSDGQFRKLICKTKNDKPLTWLMWQKDLWTRTMKLSKKEMIDILNAVSTVSELMLLEVGSQDPCDEFTYTHENLTVSRCIENGMPKLFLESEGGPRDNYESKLIHHIYTTRRWQHRYYDPIWDFRQKSENVRGNQKPIVSEEAIVELLTCENLEESFDDLNTSEDGQKTFLNEILSKLIQCGRKVKWEYVTPRDLYINKLATADSISENFINKEMDIIAEVLCKHTNTKLLFNKSSNKSTKVNTLAKYFGDKSVWYPKVSSRSSIKMKKLKVLCTECINSNYYPKTILAACICRIEHDLEFHMWKNSQQIPMGVYIDRIERHFQFFAFPEYSEERHQTERRTFDPTHILTNMRSHICKKGFQHVRAEAFLEVSDRNNDLLSRALLTEDIDKQNLEVALHIFREEVEEDIRKHGDTKSADFIGLLRRWFMACDARGIPLNDRLNWLVDLHEYMMDFYDPFDYPPPSTHIYRLPIQSFEMILQSISARIFMYLFAKNNKFNNRALSTLGIESCYSDLSIIEITGSGCPKAYQIPKLISILQEYNTAKHDPTKLFTIDKRRGVPYPVRLMEQLSSQDDSENEGSTSLFHTHSFDRIPRIHKKRKKFNPVISGPQEPSRGEGSIRTVGKYKLNETKIDSMTRLGLPKDYNI